MKRYIVRDIRNGMYKIKSKHYASEVWTEDKTKAFIFKTKGAAKCGCYYYSINPSCKLGAKIILPDWIEIIEIEIDF